MITCHMRKNQKMPTQAGIYREMTKYKHWTFYEVSLTVTDYISKENPAPKIIYIHTEININ